MTNKKIAITAVSETISTIRQEGRWLKTFSGEALVELYEDPKSPGIQLFHHLFLKDSTPVYIVGAQPLILPFGSIELFLNQKLFDEFCAGSVMVGWWYIRTVALFDEDMLEELLSTDQKDLYVTSTQFNKFLGNPVLIPFEKPCSTDDQEILGCLFGVYGYPNAENILEAFGFKDMMKEWRIVLCPVGRNLSTGKTSLLTVSLGSLLFEKPDSPVNFSCLIGEALTNWKDIPEMKLCVHELFSKIAYLLTETPDVTRCVSVQSPRIIRPRKKPVKIIPPDTARYLLMGEEFGSAIRTYSARASSLTAAKGTVRPHIRRAHWHTYLTGTCREKRILKWILPILVKSADLSQE